MSNSKTEQINRTVTNSGNDVILNVTIGNAQIGGSLVRWKNDPNPLKKGNIKHLNLGQGIAGKTLEIITNMVDINDQTNGLVVTYFLQNTDEPSHVMEDKVAEEGGHFKFILSITFN